MTRKTARALKPLLIQLEKHRTAIGKHRDALQDLKDDITSLLESTTQADASLEDAIELLSQNA